MPTDTHTIARSKIILPLDFPDGDLVSRVIIQLGSLIETYKIGFEQISTGCAYQTAAFATSSGAQIFYDGKFKDTPQTVESACRAVVSSCPRLSMLTVHADGGRKMIQAAVRGVHNRWEEMGNAAHDRPKLLAVTVLTSLGYDDLAEVGQFSQVQHSNGDHENQIEQLVLDLARLAQDSGADGVITSPREAREIREACGPDFLIVTPGIRPEWASKNDQARVMTPGEAIMAGADYLVIGRPIIYPPKEIITSVSAFEVITNEIAQAIKACAPTNQNRRWY